jgi:hypothetical protein
VAPLSAFLLTFEAAVVVTLELSFETPGVVVVMIPPPIFLVVVVPTAVGVVPALPFTGARVVDRFPAIRFSEAINCWIHGT